MYLKRFMVIQLKSKCMQVSQDFVDLVFLLRKLDSSAITQAYSALNGACTKYESSLR